MARLLDRLGKAAARRKWLTIGVWVLVAVALFGWAKAAGGKTVDVYTIPGAPSQEARDLLKERFPAQSGDTASIVFQARNGTIADPANQAAIAQTEANLQPGTAAHVTQVIGPTTPVVGPAFVSKYGTIGYLRVQYDESKDNLRSVVDGLGATARVITSAALIMISVFLSFVGDPDPMVKMFGVGLAVAVFVDATIVRLVLVPATMELLGAANWWLPGWLGRLLPEIHIEEGKAPTPVSVPTGGN